MGNVVDCCEVIVHSPGTLVCRWSKHAPSSTPYPIWKIIEPTSVHANSYWATRPESPLDTNNIVRVGAEGLLTLEQYDRAWKDYRNEKLWEILK